jgi:trigger factor
MNITAETTGTLQQQITIEITSQDYKPKVATELKKIAQRVVIPGFRPGKAPAGMVQRTYGGELTIDTINNIINTELDKYITENKLNIFGYPMPAPDQNPPILIKTT